jgi:hypothetical protein
MPNPPPDPATAPSKPPYAVPTAALRSMALALPRPGADEPETAWQEVVQGGLDTLGMLDPRDALEATLAIQFVALGAAAADACRLAFEPGTTAAQALRQRAGAASLTRAMGGIMRLLTVQRTMPAVEARDWGGVAAEVATAWQAAPARPAEAQAGAKAEAEPEVIVKWIDEIDDAELAIAVEQDRREKAGEPPLPSKGPKVLYRYKPEDYIRRFKPDERAKRPYPGWENMTKPERREFFGYTYTGPVAPLEMLTPASRAAAAAGEE